MSADAPPPSLTDEQVAAIRARLDARTPGQWLHTTTAPFGYVAKCGDSADASEYVTPRDLDWPANGAHHDAEFIAHAPEDIAALLTDRDRLARRVEEMGEMLRAARGFLHDATAGTLDPTQYDAIDGWLRRYSAQHRAASAPRPTTEETPSPSPAQETP